MPWVSCVTAHQRSVTVLKLPKAVFQLGCLVIFCFFRCSLRIVTRSRHPCPHGECFLSLSLFFFFFFFFCCSHCSSLMLITVLTRTVFPGSAIISASSCLRPRRPCLPAPPFTRSSAWWARYGWHATVLCWHGNLLSYSLGKSCKWESV